MKRKTKRLLGVLGLAVVMVVTAIAYALPVPEAHAEGELLQDDQSITIQVKVVGPGETVQLVSPSGDEETITKNIVSVEYNYQKMKVVYTNLSCTSASQARAADEAIVVHTMNGTADNDYTGTEKFDIDLNALNIQTGATCRIFLTGEGISGTDVRDEGVEFQYRAIKVDMPTTGDDEEGKPITDEKGDPEVTIGISDDVYSLFFQVYDASGNPVFAVDGVEEPILVSRDKFDLESGSYTLNLPMSQYGAKSGWYELVAIAYAQDGKEVVSMNVYRFYYDSETPNVPGTGTIMENLNISRADYVVTGLIAFGAVAVFGVYLVARKSRR